jgi:hypothetical protein
MKNALRIGCLTLGWLLIAAGAVSGIGALFDGQGTFAMLDFVGILVGALLVWAAGRFFADID